MGKYESNPNQRSVLINRDMPQKDSGEKYLAVYEKKLTAAAQELSEVPFKLYIYLLCNKDKYDLWFSPKVFASSYGVNVDTARKAFNLLIEKGYILEIGKNQYSFYEEPQKKNQIKITIQEETRMVEQEDGTFLPYTYSQFYNELSEMGYAEPMIKEQWEAYE